MLPAFDAFLGAEPMLDKEQAAIWFENASHLAEGKERIGDRTQRPSHNDRIDRTVGKGDRACRPLYEFSLYAGVSRTLLRQDKQAGRRIEANDHLDLGAIKRKIQPRADAHFEHAAASESNDFAAVFFKLRLPHHPIEQRRENPALVEIQALLAGRFLRRLFAPQARHGVTKLRGNVWLRRG